jgi:3',5'-cyclic AMP phosphodiesterase CpdA
VFWGFGDDQLDWLADETAAAGTTWNIAYGHHPFISNGPHGNAGEYEGLDWVPIVNGESIEDFVDEGICGTMDVYICGHDHSLQWPEGTCGTEFLVSGAGAKTTELEGSNNSWFQQEIEGFVWIEIQGRTFTGVYYDLDGNELYRRSFTK